MALETWLIFCLVALAPAISPGPGILFAVTTALRYGASATVVTGIANAAGLIACGLAVGFGLGALMAASNIAYFGLKLIGGAYLIWLGIKIWRDRSAFLVDPEAATGPTPYARLARQSLTIAVTNPKAVALLAALLPPFLDPSAPLGPQVWILTLTYAALCALNHVLIALAGGWVRRFLTSPRRARALRQATGTAFIGFGAALAVSGRP